MTRAHFYIKLQIKMIHPFSYLSLVFFAAFTLVAAKKSRYVGDVGRFSLNFLVTVTLATVAEHVAETSRPQNESNCSAVAAAQVIERCEVVWQQS